MDFIDRLLEVANTLPVTVRIHSMDKEESMRLTALPGGRTVEAFMDGSKEKELNYEFVYKTKNDEADRVMIELGELLEEQTDISSKNNSYQFVEINIVDEPSFLGYDDKKFLYYRLAIKAILYFEK
ncbi:phage tail terminator protein [Enterococcus faecium]|uniref:phage tail terminator protein n=1 Tax=Enterococcus faecium TaxID=1352 RepID=UPI000F4D949D|nr:minor capsid protein [Enterococcus faecium]ROY16669.1 minor capsid protein [Enterococcus faecium]HAR1751241.1 minor capsid protein [Enterococcus faecium]